MMTREEVLKAICEVLSGEFECEPAKLTPDARLFEDLDLDSIDAVDLIVRIQQESGIKVVADDFKSIRTLGDVAEVICRLMSAK